MTPADVWTKWQAKSSNAARERWSVLEERAIPVRKGAAWLDQVKERIAALAMLGILQPRESGRVKALKFDHVAKADQKRLREQYEQPHRTIYAIGIATADRSEATEDHTIEDRTLHLNDGKRLHNGRLGLQVFIDEYLERPVGMNVQLSGFDPIRMRPWYLRYDLDSVQMGANPVAHFRAHWHVGDEPDADDAEMHDPRLPSLILDPVAVIETLVETIFPNGPADLIAD